MKSRLPIWITRHLLRTGKNLRKGNKRNMWRTEDQRESQRPSHRICGTLKLTNLILMTEDLCGIRSERQSTLGLLSFPRTCLNNFQRWPTCTSCSSWFCKLYPLSLSLVVSLLFSCLYFSWWQSPQSKISLKISKDTEQTTRKTTGKR